MTLQLTTGRLLLTWLVLAIGMSANGVAREIALKRVLSPVAADMMSAVTGMALIGIVTAIGLRPLRGSSDRIGELAVESMILIILTLVFETMIGRAVDHMSWGELAAHYAVWNGELWPVVLLWLACMPFLWARTT